MEPVPDMDVLLDEVENSIFKEPFSISSNGLEAHKMMNEKTRKVDWRESEFVVKEYPQLTQHSMEPLPQFFDKTLEEQAKILQEKTSEKSERPITDEHADFDEALKQYWKQFSDEEDDHNTESIDDIDNI